MNAAGEAAAALARSFAAPRPPVPLRRHQQEALTALERVLARGHRRAWVVLPPGLGKTLAGLEAARRLGRRTVVFGPNTAIQHQWIEEWAAFAPRPEPAGTGRALESPLTVLTYQALASFDPEAEVDEEGALTTAHLHRLRPQGRELVEALRGAGEVTLLLDECHHLLDTWGVLLAELLRELPRATVIGLTATPPERLTRAQAELVEELFGPAVRGPSIPAAVREGHLAPYAELAWLTTPTGPEAAWLSAEAERFTELTAGLLEPSFASVPFLGWLDERIVRRARTGAPGDHRPALSWHRFENDHPELAAAALRFHHHGLLALPEGARLREEHRHPPDAGDWVCLLDDWIRRCLRAADTPGDRAAEETIRAALPSVGYQLTKSGVRAGRSPVDRVVARSAAKTAAVREILAAEREALGPRLRAVVVCDHERATATLPSGLAGVLDAQAGSARLVLTELVADPRTAPLAALLVTGRTVAADPDTAARFAAFCTAAAPGLELTAEAVPELPGAVCLTGAWTSRRWVALATRFFEEGGTRALVGTRALLGEGWNAKGVNTLVDLTEATTATAVVQTRGRALRLDPQWPEKTAATWSVVCVAPDHPRGTTDWERFVRKHEGYLGVTDTGAVMSGVAHVDPGLSPYAPPPAAEFDALNAAMLQRSRRREQVRRLWRIGEPYEDRLGHTVRVTPGPDSRPAAAGAGLPAGYAEARLPVAVPAARGTVPAEAPGGRLTAVAGGAGAAAATGAGVLLTGALPILAPLLAAPAGWAAYRAVHRLNRARGRARLLRAAAAEPVVLALAWAVADGMCDAGLIPRGADAVTAEPDEHGAYQVRLAGASLEQSALFAAAYDEVLAPIAAPRHLLPRHLVERYDLRAGWRPGPHAVVYHAVPAQLSSRRRLEAFAAAWRARVSAGEPVSTRTPHGAGLLAAQRGLSPLDVTTALRVNWS